MKYVIGVLAGALWGFLAAMLNNYVLKKALESGSHRKMLGANILRALIAVGFFAAVILLRNRMPFNYLMAIVGTAAGMSMTTIYLVFKTAAGNMKNTDEE